MIERLFKKFCGNKILVVIAKAAAMVVPPLGRLKKYRNILASSYSIGFQQTIVKNNPIRVLIAPISICNYKCLFCEIHKDNLLYPDRTKNVVDLSIIKNYESFLSFCYKLNFSGGTEEPLLNKHFGEIAKYLKQKYGIRMMVNTNASMLKRNLADTLINCGFDSVLVSYHAGSKEKYKELMTGNIDVVDENLKYLKEQKELKNATRPVIKFNFALHKLNADEYPFILQKAKLLGVTEVIINKYYGGRNRLQDKRVSFDYDIDEGNRVLDDIYSSAKNDDINLSPPRPQYWTKDKSNWDSENFNASKKCPLPWTDYTFLKH